MVTAFLVFPLLSFPYPSLSTTCLAHVVREPSQPSLDKEFAPECAEDMDTWQRLLRTLVGGAVGVCHVRVSYHVVPLAGLVSKRAKVSAIRALIRLPTSSLLVGRLRCVCTDSLVSFAFVSTAYVSDVEGTHKGFTITTPIEKRKRKRKPQIVLHQTLPGILRHTRVNQIGVLR